LFHILRGGKITDCLHVPLERPHAVLVYSVSQELHGGGGEYALCRVDLQAALLKDGEDLPEMLDVLLQAVAGDDDVVQVAEHEGEVFEYRMLSMKRWKVWAALRRPKDMKRYSNKPNGVMIAVLAMSWAAIGI
jgi:hypothetical protein